MIAPQFNEVLERLDEVRAIFILGQRAVPFMEDVLGFLKDITPILDDINASVQFSTSNMPKAASQLQSVTQATELATTEILNVLDQVFVRLDEVEAEVKEATEQQGEADAADAELYQQLEAVLGTSHPDLWVAVQDHRARQTGARQGGTDAKDTVVAFASKLRSQLSAIMMSLQVQDITAQKLASVNQLIEAVRNRMDYLTHRLANNERRSTAPAPQVPKPAAAPGFLPQVFDHAADYDHDKSEQQQSSADAIINQFQSGDGASGTPAMQPPITPPPSQGDIDTLFNNPSGDASAGQSDIDALFAQPKAAPAPVAPPAASPPAPAANEQASVDDIDALFAGGGSDEPASADDIDALFGGGADEPASADDIDALFGAPTAAPVAPVASAVSPAPATNERASVDDIDALFAGGGSDEPASADDIDALFGGGADEPASADDIDALFGPPATAAPSAPTPAPATNERASADDIDALFASGDSATASQDDIDALFG